MDRTTIDMLRAYLVTASGVAVCMDGVVVLLTLAFHVSNAFFDSSIFQIVVLAILIVSIGTIRLRAMRAFWRARETRGVIDLGSDAPVVVEDCCPSLDLVILHLQLSRRAFHIHALRDGQTVDARAS